MKHAGLKLLLWLALPLYVLDQVTKWLASTRIDLHDSITVIPNFFDLVHVTNTGAAFGSFAGGNTFFIVLACVVAAGLVLFFLRGAFPDRWSQVAVALLFSGIVGNLTDRILHGHVIDFLSFDLHIPLANPWPSFNVADSCICIAAGMLFIAAFRDAKRKAA